MGDEEGEKKKDVRFDIIKKRIDSGYYLYILYILFN